ncbi:MAG: MerR family transcriptional regulator [Flavisolibacter sp.]
MPREFTQITFDFFSEPPAEAPAPDARPEVAEAPTPEKQPATVAAQVAGPKKRGRKKLSELDAGNTITEVPEDDILFQKQYYSIGEVSAMFRVNNSLLRYWEKEFDVLKLRKNRKGDRFFRPTDIKTVELIYDLLRRRKFTIEGAKTFLKKQKQIKEKHELIQSLQKIRSFLLELKANL